ncbi:MAG: ABC transporter permease [Phycisphaerae bacterium]
MTGEVWQQIGECLRNLPSYLGQHVLISALALGIGIVVSLPLAILGARSKALRWPVLTAASIIQTIPSMALLALFFPVLVGVSYVTNRLVGVSISALGFLPTIIALTLYSMLPVLRNTVTAITGVDPAMTEAARGLGMRPRQVLLKVELPLALPVIIAGVRTATVWSSASPRCRPPSARRAWARTSSAACTWRTGSPSCSDACSRPPWPWCWTS